LFFLLFEFLIVITDGLILLQGGEPVAGLEYEIRAGSIHYDLIRADITVYVEEITGIRLRGLSDEDVAARGDPQPLKVVGYQGKIIVIDCPQGFEDVYGVASERPAGGGRLSGLPGCVPACVAGEHQPGTGACRHIEAGSFEGARRSFLLFMVFL